MHGRLAVLKPRFHQVGKLSEAHRPRHARAALERVQRAPQLRQRAVVARVAAPCTQFLARLWIQLRRFVEEDRQYLRIDVVADALQRIRLHGRQRAFGSFDRDPHHGVGGRRRA